MKRRAVLGALLSAGTLQGVGEAAVRSGAASQQTNTVVGGSNWVRSVEITVLADNRLDDPVDLRLVLSDDGTRLAAVPVALAPDERDRVSLAAAPGRTYSLAVEATVDPAEGDTARFGRETVTLDSVTLRREGRVTADEQGATVALVLGGDSLVEFT